jgi:hypothetical protein
VTTIPGPDVTYTALYYADRSDFARDSRAAADLFFTYEAAEADGARSLTASFDIRKRYVRTDLVTVNDDGSISVRA